MKRIILCLLFISASLHAQTVYIPDVNFKVKLINLGLDTNLDEEIQVSEALTVYTLVVSNSSISNLEGIQAFTNLTSLNCGGNLLTEVNLNNLTNLQELWVSYNELNSLDVSNLTNLKILGCQSNNLTSIDLSNLTNLEMFACTWNQISSLDVSALTNLITIACGENLFPSLDLSNNPNLCLISCVDSPSLTQINMKNGSVSCPEDRLLWGNPNLTNVCVDQGEALSVMNHFITHNMPNVNVNTYCSFVPGGNFNTMTGTVTYDFDNNGCGPDDVHAAYIKVKINDNVAENITFTNSSGNYEGYSQAGTYTITPQIENPMWFTVTPGSATVNFPNTGNTAVSDFCITSNGIQNDLETIIVPLQPARPGFDAVYKIIYKNKGNQILSGSVDFSYPENELDFVNASVIPDAQGTGMLSWNFNDIYPFESRSMEVTLNVNSPMEIPAVNIGDYLSFSSQINPLAGDIIPGDNSFPFRQTVVGSFDPNDITCLEGEHVNPTEIGKYLHYNINFENTGTAAAENIVVKDMIDLSKYDISSLQILNTSHLVTTRITNDKVEFIFEDINLGASEHGNVTFKIKTKNTLVTGNSVSQKADIYFDYNFPVATNVAMTTFDTLGMDNPVLENVISFYPNPVSDILNLKSVENIRKAELYDLRGRLLLTVSESNSINLAEIPSGIYMIQVFTDTGSKSAKIIKK